MVTAAPARIHDDFVLIEEEREREVWYNQFLSLLIFSLPLHFFH